MSDQVKVVKPRKQNAFTRGVAGCFSPEAMFATMAIEFIGAAWIALRYRFNRTGLLTISLLVFLGIFQLAEFLVCETVVTGLSWARIGYMSITMLPPLGISLAMSIAGKKSLIGQIVMYVGAGLFIFYWGFTGWGITSDKCEGNYVFFQAANDAMWLYGTYYYVLLGIGTFLSFWLGSKIAERKTRHALYWLAIGYLVFIIPTTAVAVIDPATRSSIPSVMCGFAVLLALVLIFAVIPMAGTKRPWGNAPVEGDGAKKHDDELVG